MVDSTSDKLPSKINPQDWIKKHSCSVLPLFTPATHWNWWSCDRKEHIDVASYQGYFWSIVDYAVGLWLARGSQDPKSKILSTLSNIPGPRRLATTTRSREPSLSSWFSWVDELVCVQATTRRDNYQKRQSLELLGPKLASNHFFSI